jgi:NADPH:quinone reductase-like Zn-dependent oxidoreductase
VPVVDTALPLACAEQALRHLEIAAQFGKIVLTMA